MAGGASRLRDVRRVGRAGARPDDDAAHRTRTPEPAPPRHRHPLDRSSALRRVAAGETIPTTAGGGEAGVANQHLARKLRQWALTRREYDILRRISMGETNPEIAEALGITRNTVKTYVQTEADAVRAEIAEAQRAARRKGKDKPAPEVDRPTAAILPASTWTTPFSIGGPASGNTMRERRVFNSISR